MASSAAAAKLLAEDSAARARALEPSASFIVEAPAGAGKTEILIQRALALLAQSDEPEAVVALTFTRKAAAEMRARLLKAIADSQQPEPAEPHRLLTWKLARAVHARDQLRGWNLEATPARLRVETLDALALRLVARMPWLSRFSGVPAPTDSPAPLYREAARAVFATIETQAESADAARRLLLHLDANLQAAILMLADLLEDRDQWLRLAADAALAGAKLQERMQRDVAILVQTELAKLVDALGPDGVSLARLAQSSQLPGTDPACLPHWRELAGLALTQAGGLRKKLAKNLPLSADAAARLHLTRLLPESVPHSELVAALIELLPRAATELARVFARRAACDFTEVTLAAVAALGPEASPSALAFALDARLQHLLVDECQDTSHAQFGLLQALVREWEPGDGRTLFLVGDPMQSIYRWRNARLELFLRTATEERLGPVPLARLRLRRNFRSAPRLVEWCNQHFDAAFPSTDDLETGAAHFEPAAAVQTAGGAVACHVVEKQPGAAATEGALIAELIEAEPEGASIAVLAPTRADVASLGAALRHRGIAFAAINIEPLAQSAVVQDLCALARALSDPADRIAWLTLLRAPWCGLSLADLHALCSGDKYALVRDLWQQRRASLSPEGQARAQRVFAILEPAARDQGRSGLCARLAWCWSRLGGPACAHAANSEDIAEAFWALLEKLEGECPEVDLDRLALESAKLYAPPQTAPGPRRVQIMTVHQAKGLEFDAVLLVGLARQARNSEPPLLRWIERAAAAPDNLGWLLSARPRPGDSEGDPSVLLYQYLGEHQKAENRNEDLRQFYVATTRAKRQLHLIARLWRKNDGSIAPPPSSLLARLWEASCPDWISAWNRRRIPALHPAPSAPAPPLRRVPAGWAPAPPPSGVAWRGARLASPPSSSAEVQESRGLALRERALGTAVHAELQRIAESGALQINPARLRLALRAAGIAATNLDAACREASTAIERTLADPRGRWLLEPHQSAVCEWPLAGFLDGEFVHALVDRSFIADGIRWVVDYKLARPEPGQGAAAFLAVQAERYRSQLLRYARLAAALDPGPIRPALYFPHWSGWLELDPTGS